MVRSWKLRAAQLLHWLRRMRGVGCGLTESNLIIVYPKKNVLIATCRFIQTEVHCSSSASSLLGRKPCVAMRTKPKEMTDVISRFYPENEAGGFSRLDGTVQFYQRVRALLGPGHRILDFGAGRGAAYYEDPSPYRKGLRDLRGEGRCIIGADVDPIVSSNPWLDEAIVLEEQLPFPFPDEHFDLIVSDSTFEHIAEPTRTVFELGRVLKTGGWICARTPNRYGYVALINRMMPSRMSKRLLTSAQPDRQAKDVFPAY